MHHDSANPLSLPWILPSPSLRFRFRFRTHYLTSPCLLTNPCHLPPGERWVVPLGDSGCAERGHAELRAGATTCPVTLSTAHSTCGIAHLRPLLSTANEKSSSCGAPASAVRDSSLHVLPFFAGHLQRRDHRSFHRRSRRPRRIARGEAGAREKESHQAPHSARVRTRPLRPQSTPFLT